MVSGVLQQTGAHSEKKQNLVYKNRTLNHLSSTNIFKMIGFFKLYYLLKLYKDYKELFGHTSLCCELPKCFVPPKQ